MTHQPGHDEHEPNLPRHVQPTCERFHARVFEQPWAAIPELEAALKRYPDVRRFDNFLFSAYKYVDKDRQAKRVLAACRQRFPDYLFGKLNEARVCLEEGRIDEVAELFDPTFDLKHLYPRREVFHISEFVSFMYVSGCYFARKGWFDRAEARLEALETIAPDAEQTSALAEEIEDARRPRRGLFGWWR